MKTIITMKNNIKLIRAALILLTMISGLSGCTERWEEMNTDPNRLTSIPDEYLFTSAVRGAFNDGSQFFNTTFGGQYAHIFVASNWERSIDKYEGNGTKDYSEWLFEGIYNSVVRNSVEVMKLTSPEGKYENKYRYAQAQFMAMIGFSKLTDTFGDIPYSEAGMGKYGVEYPVYDEQQNIYSDMVDRMKNIIALLKEDAAKDNIYPKGIDPIYDGNVDNWIRFANSFRLHLAMRARFADPGKYEAVIAECLSEELIDDNSQNPTLWTSDSKSDLYNPWWWRWNEAQEGTFNLVWAYKFINMLKVSNDPRLPFYATKGVDPSTGDTTYIGLPNGLSDEEYTKWNRKDISIPSGEFFAKDQPVYLFITAAEITLLRAEAALYNIGNSSEDANTLYQEGIALAMDQWDIPFDSISKYLSDEPEAALTGDTEDDFRKISTQIYISCVPNALEAWNTIRRTGYPVIPQRTGPDFVQGVTNGYMPTRVSYPMTKERTINGENMQAAIDRMPGGDVITETVWWDVHDAPNH